MAIDKDDVFWTATTNWIEAEGSLTDSISYDTSATSDDDDAAAAAAANAATKGLLLVKPDVDDPPPCEITISFRKKHEIHRVYVRSTARIYEIYYGLDHKDISKEYLCTVQCGAAEPEVMPQNVPAGYTSGCEENNNGTVGVPQVVVRSGSNTSDEDGWVQVKSPDSVMQDEKEFSLSKRSDCRVDSPKMQVHFEATAEISDSDPCVSLTLRLLSLQIKDCVHVEEIYVYADPDESSDSSDPPVTGSENNGASSFLAMLVPSLMQLSKSRTTRDNTSDESRLPKYEYGAEKTDRSVSAGIMNTRAREECSKWGLDRKPSGMKAEKVQCESLVDQHSNQAYSRIEKVLDELVRKVGRVEDFCSKIEEKMLKPLSCIEERLERLEDKLDALAVKTESSEQCHCSNVCAPESNESNSEKNKGSSTRCTESRENATFMATTVQTDDLASPVPEYHTCPGLVIRAPEFLVEDDDSSGTDDTSDESVEDLPQIKKPSSMESALASSLAAFLSSTTVESPEPVLSPRGSSHESVNSDTSAVDSLVCISSEVDGIVTEKSISEVCGFEWGDAAKERVSFGDPSLLPCDGIAFKYELNISDTEKKGTTSSDSLLATNVDVTSPVPVSRPVLGSVIMSLGFLNEDINPNSDDLVVSPEFDSSGDQASMPGAKQTDPLLAELLSSRRTPSSDSTGALFSTPSSYCAYSNQLSDSIAQVRSGGEKKGKTSSDSLLATNVDVSSPVPASRPVSGSVIMSLGFLNEDINPSCDDLLVSPEFDSSGDQASMPGAKQTVPLLVEFLNSRTIPSSDSTGALFSTPSSSCADSNQFNCSSSIARVPSGGEKKGTTSSNSLLATNVEVSSPVPASRPVSGSVIMSLGFLNEDINPNCDDLGVSPEFDSSGDQASMPGAKQTVPILAEFLSSRTTPSSDRTGALFNTPSSSYAESNQFSDSIARVPSGGAYEYGANQMKNEVNMLPSLSMSLPKSISELADDSIVGQNEWSSMKLCDGTSVQDLNIQTLFELNVARDGSSTSSIRLENLTKPTAETECLTGGSGEIPAYTVNDYANGTEKEKLNTELDGMICNMQFVSKRKWTNVLEEFLSEMKGDQVLDSTDYVGDGNDSGEGQQLHCSSSSQVINGESDSQLEFKLL